MTARRGVWLPAAHYAQPDWEMIGGAQTKLARQPCSTPIGMSGRGCVDRVMASGTAVLNRCTSGEIGPLPLNEVAAIATALSAISSVTSRTKGAVRPAGRGQRPAA